MILAFIGAELAGGQILPPPSRARNSGPHSRTQVKSLNAWCYALVHRYKLLEIECFLVLVIGRPSGDRPDLAAAYQGTAPLGCTPDSDSHSSQERLIVRCIRGGGHPPGQQREWTLGKEE